MLSNAAGHQLVVTIEDGFREGGFGSAVYDAITDISPGTRVTVLGVPIAHHAHGRPEDLLASFGLDAAGVASAALERLT
jgi:1-deoxy-D-xylulose-5-phosphate synthase